MTYDKWRATDPTDAQYCRCGMHANDCWMDEYGHCDLDDPPGFRDEDCPQEEEAPEPLDDSAKSSECEFCEEAWQAGACLQTRRKAETTAGAEKGLRHS